MIQEEAWRYGLRWRCAQGIVTRIEYELLDNRKIRVAMESFTKEERDSLIKDLVTVTQAELKLHGAFLDG